MIVSKIFILLLTVLTVTVVTVQAQPPVDWIRTYDAGLDEGFMDIYRVPNDGYACCGFQNDPQGDRRRSQEMWIIRIEENGELTWSNLFGEMDSQDALFSIIETDRGEFLSGGRYGDQFSAILVDEDGEQIWLENYGQGECLTVIELKAGQFLLGGRWAGGRAAAVLINGEGDVLWEGSYGDSDSDRFTTMRETDAGIVLGGFCYFRNQQPVWRGWVVKLNFEGDLQWSNHLTPQANQMCFSMVSVPVGGFALTARFWEGDGGPTEDFGLLVINDQGDLQWFRRYDIRGETREDIPTGIERLPDDGYVIVGYERPGILPIAQRLRSNGTERWHRIFDFQENEEILSGQSTFNAVALGNDNSIIAAGSAFLAEGDQGRNGLLVKLQPDILEPQFISWTPQDTMLTVLIDDTVNFSVEVIDDQDDDLTYLWIMVGDTISTDSSTTVIFNARGEYDVECQVSDGEFTTVIRWHINVVDWYIDSFNPDSTDLIVRRGSWVDFNHHVRAIDEREFEYRWEHFGRGGNFEFDGDDSVRFEFDLSGEHIIRARVTSDEESETVSWDINAYSIIWWWWPHELELSTFQDSTVLFEVFPFNEESDSLEYSWFINDDQIEGEGSIVEIPFPESGVQEITAYVTEGIEADTVKWSVNVEEWSFTTDETDLTDFPSTPMLYPASPNPFNSSIKLSMYLPKDDHVSLSVFDINGREVSLLVDGNFKAGNKTFVWDANGYSAGIYIVRMDVGDQSEIRKVVLVR